MQSKLKIRELSRGYLALAAGNYGAIVLGFTISIVLTNRLGAERFGGLALLLMASQIVSLSVSNWTLVGFVGFGSREYAATGRLNRTLWARNWVVAPWAAMAGTGMLLFREELAEYLNVPVWGLWVVFAHFLTTYALTTLGAAFQAREEMPRYGSALFLEKAVALALVVLAPAAWIDDPIRIIGAYTLSGSLVCVWCVSKLGWSSLRPVPFHSGDFKQLWWFSAPLIASSWSGLLGTNWFDFIIITRYLDLSQLGLYALATQLNGVFQQATIIFSTLLLPRLNIMVDAGDHDGIRAFVVRFLPYWFLGTSMLFAFGLMATRLLVPMVFGQEFAGASRPLAILVVAATAVTYFNAFTPILNAYALTGRIAAIVCAAAVVNVAMNFVLIPPYGIAGAAAATLLAYGVSAALVLLVVRQRLRAPIFRLGIYSLPLCIVSAASLLLDGGSFYLVGVIGAAVSAYALLRLNGLFNEQDLSFLTRPVAGAIAGATHGPDHLEPESSPNA